MNWNMCIPIYMVLVIIVTQRQTSRIIGDCIYELLEIGISSKHFFFFWYLFYQKTLKTPQEHCTHWYVHAQITMNPYTITGSCQYPPPPTHTHFRFGGRGEIAWWVQWLSQRWVSYRMSFGKYFPGVLVRSWLVWYK